MLLLVERQFVLSIGGGGDMTSFPIICYVKNQSQWEISQTLGGTCPPVPPPAIASHGSCVHLDVHKGLEDNCSHLVRCYFEFYKQAFEFLFIKTKLPNENKLWYYWQEISLPNFQYSLQQFSGTIPFSSQTETSWGKDTTSSLKIDIGLCLLSVNYFICLKDPLSPPPHYHHFFTQISATVAGC